MKRVNKVAMALAGMSVASMLSSCKRSETGKETPSAISKYFTNLGRALLGRKRVFGGPAGDSPILVRGGSLGFHNKTGTQWAPDTVNPLIYTASVTWKQVIPEGTDNDTPVPLDQPWKIALTFRDQNGVIASGGTEVDVCSDLNKKHTACDITYQPTPSHSNMVYIVPADANGTMKPDAANLDNEMEALRYHVNYCPTGSTTPGTDSLCDHPGKLILTIPTAANTSNTTKFKCNGGTCDIGISTQ